MKIFYNSHLEVLAHSEPIISPRFLSIYGDYKGGLELPKLVGKHS